MPNKKLLSTEIEMKIRNTTNNVDRAPMEYVRLKWSSVTSPANCTRTSGDAGVSSRLVMLGEAYGLMSSLSSVLIVVPFPFDR